MNERVSEALSLLHNAVEKRPDDMSLRQKLFDACVQGGLFDDAVRAFAGLVQKQPEWCQFHFDTVARGSARRMPEMRAAFERAVAAHPDDVMAWYGLGFIWQLLHNKDAAELAFCRGIAANPKLAALHFNLGVVVLMAAPEQAAEHMHRAVACSPTIAEPHMALGSIYMTKDRRKAIHHFREFLRLAQPYLQNYLGRAQMSIQMLTEEGAN